MFVFLNFLNSSVLNELKNKAKSINLFKRMLLRSFGNYKNKFTNQLSFVNQNNDQIKETDVLCDVSVESNLERKISNFDNRGYGKQFNYIYNLDEEVDVIVKIFNQISGCIQSYFILNKLYGPLKDIDQQSVKVML
jgi:hypothetical protein